MYCLFDSCKRGQTCRKRSVTHEMVDRSISTRFHIQDHPYSIFHTPASPPALDVSHFTQEEDPAHTLFNQSETSHTASNASRVLFSCSKNSGLNTFCERRGTGTGSECSVPSVRRWNLCGLVWYH